MRRLMLLGGILLVAALTVAGFRFFSDEDNWICRDGQWIAHGQPAAPKPDLPCAGVAEGPAPAGKITESIKIADPAENDTVQSPLKVSGEARGGWYFEASFPVRLEDGAGRILAAVPAQAQGEWMTEDFVPFAAELSFSVATLTPGRLVFSKDNPSGLPEFDAEKSIAVMIAPPPTVKVFFPNDRLDPEVTCEKVWPVERTTVPGSDMMLAALEALLEGPSESEAATGYSTAINSGVVVNKAAVDAAGIARIDLSPRLNEDVAGSCRVGLIRAEISETAKQFPGVREVVISVNGETDEILQP